MKKYLTLIALLFLACPLIAQKVDYKSGVLSVDGTDIAKVVRIKDKESFGITGTYELYSIGGTKLIIATLANDYVPDRNDNSTYYYRFTFLTTNQDAIFSLSKLGPEKSFAKLIGNGGIIVGDSLSRQKITEFIALKSKNPPIAMKTDVYSMVKRSRDSYMELNSDQTITQDRTIIGGFKDVSQSDNVATYQFTIPSGLVIATVNFKGGSGATEFFINTIKDNLTQRIVIPVKDKTMMSSIDRYQSTIERLTKWLIAGNYL